MRSIMCVVIMLALIGLAGCAKKEPAAADQNESTVIATEDFESGEVEALVEDEAGAVVEEVEEVVDEAHVPDDPESTP